MGSPGARRVGRPQAGVGVEAGPRVAVARLFLEMLHREREPDWAERVQASIPPARTARLNRMKVLLRRVDGNLMKELSLLKEFYHKEGRCVLRFG